MRKVFIILGCCLVLCWLVLYYLAHELDCAFEAHNPCGVPKPWEVRGVDLWISVIGPGVLAIGLFVAAWRAGPKA